MSAAASITTKVLTQLRIKLESWPRKTPLKITGYQFEHVDVLVVELEAGGRVGRAEAAGIYYKGDVPSRMAEQIEALRGLIEAGLDRERLQALLPAGGARNALDCALWDLEAKLTGHPVWALAGLSPPAPLTTAYTCGANTPEIMAERAAAYLDARAIKLKLTGEDLDAERVRAVRRARPDVWLAVDANQGFDRRSFARLAPTLVEAGVALIEQPFPLDKDAWLDGLGSPIPIVADESVQTRAELPSLRGRVDMINIKLDKSGGLTEALAMAALARELGLKVMVGNMMGTSLAMAPALLVGQGSDVVDLDGPMFLRADRTPAVHYVAGQIHIPAELWGH